MGQDLHYQTDAISYEYRISRADWELTQSLRVHLPNEIEALFEVPALGISVRLDTALLRASIETVIQFVASRKEVLPYTYQFKEEIPPDPSMTPGFGTGAMSGIRLPGDTEHYYSIHAGLNVCRLEKLAIDENGRGRNVGEQDLRQIRELLTANLGKIAIRRTRAKAELLKELPRIQQFLNGVISEEVIKRID